MGKRIKIARERLKPKLTQAKLGEALGLTGQAVSNWERGEDHPSAELIAQLKAELKVTYKWLHEGPGAPPDPGSLEVALDGLSRAEQDAVGAYIDILRRRGGKAA